MSSSKPAMASMNRENFEKDRLRVKRKTLETVLEQCQRALELLSNTSSVDDVDEDDDADKDDGKDNSDRAAGDEDHGREEVGEV